MAYQGLILKFAVDRPLDELDRQFQLKQKLRLEVDPRHQLSVVKLNSTYLEIVDKWFAWKGAFSALLLFLIGLFGGVFVAMVIVALTREPGSNYNDMQTLMMVACLIFPFVVGLTWLLCKEAFAYTHYPIRFNRKSRMVHVFRTNGTVLSVRWDKVFFTLGKLNQRVEWEVRGHVLDQDGTTVQETFALSHSANIPDIRTSPGQVHFSDPIRAHWEFVRRYMEDGPEAVAAGVQFCMPVSTRRETARESMQRIFDNNGKSPRVIFWLMFIPSILSGIARVFAMRTSKIPQWPKEIDAACPVEPNDQYAIEAGPDRKAVPVFPEAAKSAGIGSHVAQSTNA